MARAYKAKLVYTVFAHEVARLAPPILVACPKCNEKYGIVEEQDVSESDIERHKAAILQDLERNCPLHPDKYGDFS